MVPDSSVSQFPTVRDTYDSLMKLQGDIRNRSHVMIPRASHNALRDLLSFHKLWSDHNKIRLRKCIALGDIRIRLDVLSTNISHIYDRVGASELAAKKSVLKTSNHFKTVNAAVNLGEDQRTKFIDSEQKLISARDSMADSCAAKCSISGNLLWSRTNVH